MTSPSSAVLISEPDDHVQRQAALDRARARLDAARDRVVIGDRERAEAGCERRVEQLVDRRRAIPRVRAVHVQVGQHAAGACAHGAYRCSFTTGAAGAGTGAPGRAFTRMNSSTCSRAYSSGCCTGGDFMR